MSAPVSPKSSSSVPSTDFTTVAAQAVAPASSVQNKSSISSASAPADNQPTVSTFAWIASFFRKAPTEESAPAAKVEASVIEEVVEAEDKNGAPKTDETTTSKSFFARAFAFITSPFTAAYKFIAGLFKKNASESKEDPKAADNEDKVENNEVKKD